MTAFGDTTARKPQADPARSSAQARAAGALKDDPAWSVSYDPLVDALP